MKREKARLEELRNMPYADYLQTPEWLETQRAAIKRSGNHCQVCNAGDVNLSAYHKTFENLGCELEADVLTLCEGCYDLLYQKLTQGGDAPERSGEPGEESTYADFSLTKKAVVFGSSAAVTMGLPLLLHAPLPAELFGLGAAIALAANSPKLYGEIRDSLPQPLVELIDGMTERKRAKEANGEWSTLDRLLGRHMRGNASQSQEIEELVEQEPDELPALEPVFPRYEDRVTLRLGKAIDEEAVAILAAAFIKGKKTYKNAKIAGRRFDPHFNSLIGKGWVAAANQGFGKSVLNGVIIEQAGERGLPVIVLDHKGEYETVKELPFMNALLVGGSGDVDFLLAPEIADDFVEFVFKNRYQAIINLPSYGPGWLGKAKISAAIGQALMRYAEKQRQLGKKLLPCLVIMDEAQLYLPQDQSLLPPEAQANRDVLSDLKNAYFALVSNGRSAGYTIGFATQSLTYLAKWAIKSSQVRIFGRHAEKNDLDECERIIDHSIATRKQIESFPPGVAVVFGLSPQAMVLQFDQKRSRDLSETPGIELLYEERKQSGKLPPVQERLAQQERTMVERPRREVPVRQSVEREQTARRPVAGLSQMIREASEVYVPGMSYWDLGAELGYTDVQARSVWQELKRRGVVLRTSTEATEQAEVSQDNHAQSSRSASPVRQLYSIPSSASPQAGRMEDLKPRPIDPTDLAKAFALWQAGASSVRKLESAAKAAGYPWSNGRCRDLIDAMKKNGLIPQGNEEVVL